MKRVIVMWLALVWLVGCQGCGTAARQGVSTVRVSVLDNGKLAVNGRVISKARLSRAVKAAGADESTSIAVAVPEGAQQAVMVEITRELRQAGYTRVLFTRPRRARVSN